MRVVDLVSSPRRVLNVPTMRCSPLFEWTGLLGDGVDLLLIASLSVDSELA
jgi:hypothetical protein